MTHDHDPNPNSEFQPWSALFNGLVWTQKHPAANFAALGHVPEFLEFLDRRPAKEQIHEHYSHGGGWQPIKRFKLLPNGDLLYPGDLPLKPLAEAKLRNETIRFYAHSWLAIIQPDGSYEVSGVD